MTYNGWPLYYYRGDSTDSIKCQAIKESGDYWYIIKTNGEVYKESLTGNILISSVMTIFAFFVVILFWFEILLK